MTILSELAVTKCLGTGGSYADCALPPLPLQLERSYSPWGEDLGRHASHLRFYVLRGDIHNGQGLVEWEIPSLHLQETIGITIDDGALTDYDGVMSLPDVVGGMLRALGVVVDVDEYEIPLDWETAYTEAT